MKAMIFAAGMGTRLKPLTDTMPKALVPVGGKPLLAWQLDKLVAAGATNIIVNIHHFANQVEQYLADYVLPEGVCVHISDERTALLETGGALKKAAPWLAADDGPVLVHNVDILSNVDLKNFYARNRSAGTTLLVSERSTNRYLLFDESGRLMGWTNTQTGEVRSPYAKERLADCRKYAFSGIQLVSPDLFPLMKGWPERFSIIDFYLHICHQVPIYGWAMSGLRLLDVGKQDTLQAAESFAASLV